MTEYGFILYGSDGCHLCEDAIALCHQLSMPIMLTLVDIVDEEDLVDAYGQHIPVMQRDIDGKELFWPFNLEQLTEFVADGLVLAKGNANASNDINESVQSVS